MENGWNSQGGVQSENDKNSCNQTESRRSPDSARGRPVCKAGSKQVLNGLGLATSTASAGQRGSQQVGPRHQKASIYPEVRLLQVNNHGHKRKLILHFDVRNTVLVADSVWSISVEQALNSYLSGVTWGRETADGQWEWVSKAPSLKPPEPGLITYYKHVERRTKSTPSDRAALRRLTGDFTQEEPGRRFQPHVRRLLEQLTWNHTESAEQLTMVGQDGKLYHYLVPAFLHLLRHLTQQKRQFAIVIRTYGMDAPHVS